MSFSITLMNNKSEKNKVTKDVETISTITGVLKEQTSIIDPVIIVDSTVSGILDVNYMYIAAFERYYYINNVTSVRAGLIEIQAHVDVLMSFASSIKTNTGIIRRQEKDWNLYLNDGSFRVYQNPVVITKAFSGGFNAQELVLAVAGS